jgi:hypothetical protein
MRHMINCGRLIELVRLCCAILLSVSVVYVCFSIMAQHAQTTENMAYAGSNKGEFNEADFMINDFGIAKLTINSNTLSGQFISHSGKILDNFSITK